MPNTPTIVRTKNVVDCEKPDKTELESIQVLAIPNGKVQLIVSRFYIETYFMFDNRDDFKHWLNSVNIMVSNL